MSKKLIGKYITEKLSGKKGIVLQKKKKNRYIIRVWSTENSNWYTLKVPREQFELGHEEEKKIGF